MVVLVLQDLSGCEIWAENADEKREFVHYLLSFVLSINILIF